VDSFDRITTNALSLISMPSGRGRLLLGLLPGAFMLVTSSQTWLSHGRQEAALTTAGAWTLVDGRGRQVRSELPQDHHQQHQGKEEMPTPHQQEVRREGPPQAKPSKLQKEVQQEKKETPAPHQPASDRPLSGERLAAFCFLKTEFNRAYKVNPTPRDLVGGKTCAVVSNSGALLSRPSGHDIDKHDTIFRFNSAPSRGFENYVGSKTTYRLGGYFPKACLHKICYTFPGGEAWASIKWKAKAAHLRQLIHRQIPMALKNQTESLSSGFHGMLHALSMCGSVDAYEMTPSAVASKYPYHYWEKGKDTDDEKHGRHSSGDRADKNNWHAHADVEHELWRWLSTSSEASIDNSGKASYPSFDSVTCP
jgi:hypothetical protein